jgi:hypothetical protein
MTVQCRHAILASRLPFGSHFQLIACLATVHEFGNEQHCDTEWQRHNVVGQPKDDHSVWPQQIVHRIYVDRAACAASDHLPVINDLDASPLRRASTVAGRNIVIKSLS